jgi:hypothetical protein
MIPRPKKIAAGSGGSIVVEECQVCGSRELQPILFVGFLPPVNEMPPIGAPPAEQKAYPAQLLQCRKCSLAQLGLIVDPAILFPPTYPYTSGTTKILRENFAQLSVEVAELYPLAKDDLVIDIGSNDGTLLGNFVKDHRVLGIEPTNASRLAMAQGIDTINAFFNRASAQQALSRAGQAKLITATNVFAHIEDIHEIVDCVMQLLADDGVFISESHYFLSLVETVQYDTIYHEHLRYYSLTSLKHLLEMHGLEVIHARRIPTHGGSVRVYAARTGKYPVKDSVARMLQTEQADLTPEKLQAFRQRVTNSKIGLYALLRDIKAKGQKIYGVGAPSRASTLVNYIGLDDAIMDCVLEIKGSYKIGKYMPGTLIPVVEEERLFKDQPEYAMLLSWHIAEELIPKLAGRGFKGKFIIPLPEPRIVSAS